MNKLKNPTVLICKGTGCLLRYSCEKFGLIKGDDPLKQYIISLYNPSTGCINYKKSKIKGVMKV